MFKLRVTKFLLEVTSNERKNSFFFSKYLLEFL